MDEREQFEKWFSQSANERIKTDMIQVCYWDGRGDLYGEAVNLAWQAWQAAKASPVGGGVADDCGLALGDAAPAVESERQLTPWQIACMSILVAGAAASFACDVLCAFLLNPAYFLRLCLVMAKRRLRQVGGALADALA